MSSTKKRGLGKGLSALIADKAAVDTLLSNENPDVIIEKLNIDLITPKEDQPRQYFDDNALKELAESIKENGVIQPIIVRKVDESYQIVAGERRWRASKSAGLKEIPAIIRSFDEEEAAKISLIENVQRENLNPIEEAIAYKKLMDDYSLTHEELGQAVGKSRAYVSNSMRLLNLDEKVVEYIKDGKLTSGHGKVLLGIKDSDEQLDTAERIINLNLNVRDTEAEVKKTKKKSKIKTKRKSNKDPYLIDLEDNLMRSLGTKVNLLIGNKKGKIEIEYYGEDDLERLIDLLTR
ncbi:ParB/RepB/Spo0J family partition protein [Tissierella sp. Yu-01]|uniref:ParB/RepB/Spo0J family partition protein n=1 Tax=Tissierella sp. Yu-01 TaxID=3035694 RepID=UPI00240D40FB|nr:ParB/RepB/Spo0J family partition protein [Tissierella sp. Yu-01]WFA08307.1 ParB/RepB/Spo0J family partition protein [Tissierella sp. Yu-01]